VSALAVTVAGRARSSGWFLMAALATAAGLAAAVTVTLANDLVFAFADAPSHVVTARRVFDNVDPGLAQLGVHWTPLYHAAQLPLVWLDGLYRSGASAIAVSVIASLVAVAYLYKLVRLVGGPPWSAAAAGVLLGLSPSFLYFGVVPMLPAATMAAVTANVYYLTRWTITGSGWALLASGVTLCLATLVHFETWILCPAELMIVVLTARRWGSRERAEAATWLWLLAAGYGIAAFLAINAIVFGDLLGFLDGYGLNRGVLETDRRGFDQLADHPYAVWTTAGPVLVAAAAIGLVLFVVRSRSEPRRLVALLLLYPFAWFALQALTTGSWIQPGETLGEWRNLRYGATALPALAFLAAVGLRRRTSVALVTVAVLAAYGVMVTENRVAAWEDARADIPSRLALNEAARWLGDRPGGSSVLMPVHHSMQDRFQLESGIDSARFVDANDRAALRAILARPGALEESGVRWIVWIGDSEVGTIQPLVFASDADLRLERRSVANPNRNLVRIYEVPGG
jgi:Dolichyl-phosphate-mannose-protein mannosyltransferase